MRLLWAGSRYQWQMSFTLLLVWWPQQQMAPLQQYFSTFAENDDTLRTCCNNVVECTILGKIACICLFGGRARWRGSLALVSPDSCDVTWCQSSSDMKHGKIYSSLSLLLFFCFLRKLKGNSDCSTLKEEAASQPVKKSWKCPACTHWRMRTGRPTAWRKKISF